VSPKLTTWALRAAFALLLLGVFTVSAYSAFSLFVRRGVTTVPELVGLSEERATALLADLGLRVRSAEPRHSAAVEAGRVVETAPPAGSLVKRGAPVELVFSLGPEQGVVPDLAGRALPAAQLTLRAEGLALGDTLSVVAAAEPGAVVGQAPRAGAAVPLGTRVDLLVALDQTPRTYVMPDLVYRRYEPVRRALELAGFRFGAVKHEPYEGIAEGTILRQLPLPGHPLRQRDVISLVVAAPTPAGGAA